MFFFCIFFLDIQCKNNLTNTNLQAALVQKQNQNSTGSIVENQSTSENENMAVANGTSNIPTTADEPNFDRIVDELIAAETFADKTNTVVESIDTPANDNPRAYQLNTGDNGNSSEIKVVTSQVILNLLSQFYFFYV